MSEKPRHEWIAEQMAELGMYTQAEEVRKIGAELAERRTHEYICPKCGLRNQDVEPAKGDF